MIITKTELQVAEGLAADFDLRALHYGVLLHRLRAHGTGVRTEFEFLPFIDGKNNPLRLPGIEPDDERVDFERGHGTPLDLRLVRRSAFDLQANAATNRGVGALQQVFLIVKPKEGSSFERALGLRWVSGSDVAVTCAPEGLAPQRLWCTPEWEDSRLVQDETFNGDLTEWIQNMTVAAAQAAARKTASGPANAAPARPEAPIAPAESATPNARSIEAVPHTDAAAASPTAPLHSQKPSVIRPPAGTSDRALARNLSFAAGAALLFYVMWPTTPPADPSPRVAAASEPGRAPSSRPQPQPQQQPVSIQDKLAKQADSILIPVGNSPAERQMLYDPKTGFETQYVMLNALIESAHRRDAENFDRNSAALSASKQPAPLWPVDALEERTTFKERMRSLINDSVEAGSTPTLQRAVEISERYLQTHFGLANAHLDLSLALTQLGRPGEALAPAHHFVYYNPDGINGYFALGLALAVQGNHERAIDVYCTALRKSGYSDTTVEFFSQVASGTKYGRTGTAKIMQSALEKCPKSTWGPK